jgi:hypothetical protein
MKLEIVSHHAHEREFHDGRERKLGRRDNSRNPARSARKQNGGNWDSRFEAVERELPLKLGTGGAPEIAALSGSLPKAPRLCRGIFT